MDTINPFSGEAWAEVADAPEAVDVAVRAARQAFEDGPWATMSARERAGLMRKLGEALTRDAEELAKAETRDNGKIIRETTAQAKSLESYLDYFAGMADKIVGQQIPAPSSQFLVYTENLTPAVLELGGKSPQILFADADIEAATNGLLAPQATVAATRSSACIATSVCSPSVEARRRSFARSWLLVSSR